MLRGGDNYADSYPREDASFDALARRVSTLTCHWAGGRTAPAGDTSRAIPSPSTRPPGSGHAAGAATFAISVTAGNQARGPGGGSARLARVDGGWPGLIFLPFQSPECPRRRLCPFPLTGAGAGPAAGRARPRRH